MEGKSSLSQLGFTEKLCDDLAEAFASIQMSVSQPLTNSEQWTYVVSQFNVTPNKILRIKSILNVALKYVDIKKEKHIFKKQMPMLISYIKSYGKA